MRSKKLVQEIPEALIKLIRASNQTQLAKLTGISQSTLSLIAHERIKRLRLDYIHRLIEVFQNHGLFPVVVSDPDALNQLPSLFFKTAQDPSRLPPSWEDILCFLIDPDETGLKVHRAVVRNKRPLFLIADEALKDLYASKARFLNRDPSLLATERLRDIILGSPMTLEELTSLANTLKVSPASLVALDPKGVKLFRAVLKQATDRKIKKTLQEIAKLLNIS